jgi:prepilin-type N-terminal cleavage/methylation domain-containing protein
VTRRSPARRTLGFTLLEMLVTLVVVSLVAGVLSQALFQLSRVERLLEGGQLSGMADSVRADWIRSAIESLLPGEVGGSERLRGSERELQGLSADVPMLPAPGLAALHLRLEFDEALGMTQLQLLQTPASQVGEAREPLVLLSWPGREGRFRYLDDTGTWQENWPLPSNPRGAGLPRAISVETGLAAMPFLVAATRASPMGLLTRRQVESL